jgi:hypothetical protein
MEAVLQKVVAGGEDLDVEDRLVLILAFHFAKVGRFPVSQQVLEQLLAIGAADFGLEVPTTGCSLAIVGGPACGRGAGVGVGHHGMHGQRTLRRWRSREVAADQLAIVDKVEQVTPELSGLWRARRYRHGAPEAVGLAAR